MPTHRPLMAVVTQGYRGVLLTLIDVVGCARWRAVADTAGQALDPLQVLTLSRCQLVVHIVTLYSIRLLASCDRHTSMRACAATISHLNCSSLCTASLNPSNNLM